MAGARQSPATARARNSATQTTAPSAGTARGSSNAPSGSPGRSLRMTSALFTTENTKSSSNTVAEANCEMSPDRIRITISTKISPMAMWGRAPHRMDEGESARQMPVAGHAV